MLTFKEYFSKDPPSYKMIFVQNTFQGLTEQQTWNFYQLFNEYFSGTNHSRNINIFKYIYLRINPAINLDFLQGISRTYRFKKRMFPTNFLKNIFQGTSNVGDLKYLF